MATRERNNKWVFDASSSSGDLKRASVRGGVVTMGSQGFKFLLQMASMYVLGRLLVPGDFGLLAMATALTAFVLVFKDLGLSTATIQQTTITHEQVSSLFWVNTGMSIGAALVTLAIAPAVAWFYHDARLTAVVAASAAGFLVSGLGVQHQALLSRRMRFKALAILDAASMFLSTVAAIISAMADLGYWSLVIMQFVLVASYSLFCWIACSWRPSAPAFDSEVVPMLRFGKHLTGFSVINYFARNLDNVLIGHVWGADQLGFYSKAYQFLLLPLAQLNAPMQAVALPTLSRLKDDPERYRAAYARAIRLLGFLTMAITGFMLVTADWVIPFLLGPKWTPAIVMYRWLAITGLVQPIASSTGWLFMSQGRGRDMFRWSLISTSLIVASIAAGLPFGAATVAASYSLTTAFLVSPILFWFVTRQGAVRMADIYASLLLPASATAASALGVVIFRHFVPIMSPLLGLSATLPLWVLLFAGTLLLIPSGRAALGEIENLIRSHLSWPFNRRDMATTAPA